MRGSIMASGVAICALAVATNVVIGGETRMQIHTPQGIESHRVADIVSITFAVFPEMISVPGGFFTMGDGVAPCGVDEHQVTLTRGFQLGRYEVTNLEYMKALQWAYDHGYVTASEDSVQDTLDGSTEMLLNMANDYCEIQLGGDGMFYLRESPSTEAQQAYPQGYYPAIHPVKMTSWFGAVRYCDWLSMQSELPRAYEHQGNWSCNGGDPYGAEGYRLPTDAEWEYAAQFDDERIYPWGDEDPDCGRANFAPDTTTTCVGWTTPVGSYPTAPAVLGLSDMAGNMSEMCNDWFRCNLGTESRIDPVGPPSREGHVLRGGCWIIGDGADTVLTLRNATRLTDTLTNAGSFVGFRPGKTLSR